MRIITSSTHLYECLETVEKALPLRSTIPVISNILLYVKSDQLIFSSTNLEMTITSFLKQPCDTEGCILLPPKIVEIMRYFPTDEVTLDINWENYRLDITGGSARFHLYGSDPQDYPQLNFEAKQPSEGFEIEQNAFKKILKSVVFAASSEETRPAFNGILFSYDGNQLTLTASDTYRLVIKVLKDEKWNFSQKKCLIPAKVLRELLKILGDNKNTVEIGSINNTLQFNFNEINFTSRLLDEKYPEVSGVIPREYRTRIVIDRQSLENTVSRASLLTEGKNQAVNIIIGKGKLEARVSSQEGSMEEIIPIEQEGEDIELHVNTRFVLDILKIIEVQKIIIDFHGDGGPLIFRLIDDNSYLYLVLPIKKVN
ncbi:MAG: DNA polymerase III subunit beta [Bacillota bacterium]|nr:DNA polymerase III subunit beta [Bacillota bacterium]